MNMSVQRTKVDKKWKPLAYLTLPGHFDAILAAITEQGLSVTLVEKTSSYRGYVVADGNAECHVTFNLNRSNLHPGLQLVVLDISLGRSTVALIQTVHGVLVRYDNDPQR